MGAQVETAINNVTSGLSDLHLEVGSLILATSSQGEENESIRAQFASVHEQIEADRQRWKQLDTAQAATHVQQQQFERLFEEKMTLQFQKMESALGREIQEMKVQLQRETLATKQMVTEQLNGVGAQLAKSVTDKFQEYAAAHESGLSGGELQRLLKNVGEACIMKQAARCGGCCTHRGA